MISTKRANTIICERDKDKRDKLINRLSEEDAKYLLKTALTVVRSEMDSDSKLGLNELLAF